MGFEIPAGQDWGRGSASGYGRGGPWAALMWTAKQIEAKKPRPPARVVAPTVVPTKVGRRLCSLGRRTCGRFLCVMVLR